MRRAVSAFAWATGLAIVLAVGLTVAPAQAAEPADRPGLSCRVSRQSADGGLRLEIVFANATAEPVTLPPGAHLVLYHDAAATEAMEATARIDRLQRVALVVPAQGHATGLFVADLRHTEALLCNRGRPAAAGLYFYEFSRRPTFRCLLHGEAATRWPMRPACATGAGELSARREEAGRSPGAERSRGTEPARR